VRRDEPDPISYTICRAIIIGSEFASCHGFLVRLEVEVDEKAEIDGKQDATENSRIFCTGTIGDMGKRIGKVRRSGVLVSCEK
jgi:hypothetical protein